MAVHSYTGCTGKITAGPAGSETLVGFVSGDFSLAQATGKYITLGTNTNTAHTRGVKTVSGSLKKAWGISDEDLWTWFNGSLEYNIFFDAEQTGTDTYIISGCVLTDLAIEGLEAGAEGALMINASFEGLSFNRDSA